MNKLFELLDRLAAFGGGLILIALIIMWFGAVPLVAFIFGSISYWAMMALTVIMIILIVLVCRFMVKR